MANQVRSPVTGPCYMQISDAQTDPEWDAFVATVPGGHHVQTSLWAQVKAALHWRAVRRIVKQNRTIVAGAQMLLRPLGPLAAVGYVTRGPLCATGHRAVLEALTSELIRSSKQYRVQYLVVQPCPGDETLGELLPRFGFDRAPMELAPSATILIDLEKDTEQLLKGMKRQTRQNVMRSQREGIRVREGTDQDISTFYQLYRATAHRQEFLPYAEAYFAQMWRILKPAGNIQLMLAEYEGEAVSALLIASFGDRVVAKILGWSGREAARRPNEGVFWAAIQWAKSHRYRYFDMEGIKRTTAQALLQGQALSEAEQHSPDFFKAGFGGQVQLYPEAYETFLSPFVQWTFKRFIRRSEQRHSYGRSLIEYARKR